MKLLITGGAGYIGSITARNLAENGHEILIVDNMSRGHKESAGELDFRIADIEDKEAIRKICLEYKPEAAVHFAARSLVGESISDPIGYLGGNVRGSLNLFLALVENGCKHIVFSSSAAVYGNPVEIPIEESAAVTPINPYGASKMLCERYLEQLSNYNLVKFVSLRYFNAAGADTAHDLGEDHNPETHLIPRIIFAALEKSAFVSIFGTDYETRDGTCIRDYIHVNDLADAHRTALDYLSGGGKSGIFNLGNGNGFSVREIVDIAKSISGTDFKVVEEARRPGDPPVLVASNRRAESELGWKPARGNIEKIVRSAWEWHSKHPNGY